MRIHSPLFLLGALGALSVLTGHAAAQVDTSQWKCETCPFEKAGLSGTVDAGIGAVSDESAKFGEYTRLNREGGFGVVGIGLRYRGESGYFADVGGSTAAGSIRAEVGRGGVYALRLGYAEIPHHLADNVTSPFLGIGGANLTLPPLGFPAVATTAMPLASTLSAFDIGQTRKRLDLGATVYTGPQWTHRITARRDVRDGLQRIAGSFFATSSQLLAPVDQTTDQLEVSTSYASAKWQASVAYQLSIFRNEHEALTWTNPFSPVVTGAGVGRLALAPDNQFHQIVASGGYEINPMIRAHADVAIGRMTQDAVYLTPTLNASLAAALPPLPRASLDGRVDTFNGSLRITAAPIDGLRVYGSYARNVRDNRTPGASYPSIATDIFLGGTFASNQPFNFTQDRFKLNADYRGPGSLRLSAGIEHDQRERSSQETVTTRESTVWGKLGIQPVENVTLAVKLAHSERDNSGYGTATWVSPPQNLLLRKFYLADRKRDTAGLRADIAVGETVSIGLNADFAQDDYTASRIGLTDSRNVGFGADVSAALTEDTRLHAFAQGERIRSTQLGSQSFASADWSGRIEDEVDVVGIGVKHNALKGKLELGANYTYSRSRSDVSVDLLFATPGFPTATTSLDSLKLYAAYKLQDNLTLTGSFWHEDYKSRDWRLDGVLPNTVGNLLSLGDQPPRYRVNVVNVVLRYRF